MNLGDKVNKGLSLRKVIKILKNNTKKNLSTIAVGDNANDLSMLKTSNYPCIISNKSIKINNKNKIFTNMPAPMGWVTVVKKAIDKIEARN
jgi:Phosphoserine phosphatase